MSVQAYPTKIENKELETLISKSLLRFYYNLDVYAKQLVDEEDNVVYNTVYKKIDATTIRYMIRNKQGLMTYQQKFEKLRWICLDFDIRKNYINDDFDYFNDNSYRKLLEEEVKEAIVVLKELNIDYILEFSGNRGIHIWIFLNEEVNKYVGFLLIEGLIKKIDFKCIGKEDSPITLDKYPKNGKAKSNSIGLGVKIPLSFHLKSNAYSYVIQDINELEKITHLSDEFLQKQVEAIFAIKEVNVHELYEILEINNLSEVKEYDDIVGFTNRNLELDDIISSLSKCEIYDYIFSKGIPNLSEFDRTVITGTLIRISNPENPQLGKDLLTKYFSSDSKIYNEEVTEKKLDILGNLYPPSIKYLEEKYNLNCSYCRDNNINNVLELLKDSDLSVEENCEERVFFQWVINSEKKYLTQNDEVPLNFIYDELGCLNEEELLKCFISIKQGVYPEAEMFEYLRKEDKEKVRKLYSLSAKDRVLTTYAMFEINKILYGQYSSNSYSYRLNYDMNKNDIFINWNSLWLKYVKDIE
ncbi:hypothetical protein ACERII_11520, partial [Evansella sp. AB-rgal1]|uniref:TOTE conflict system archaeo-eukaryotic primase domain-containing protein n=1 Tax=Evansella sp. AB-rgal1 TaxID=3242696 RepID=UPI00359DEC6A